MQPNIKNIFQPYLVDAAAITERLEQLIARYGTKRVEAVLMFDMGDLWLKMHINNLVLTYSYTEVLEVFECMSKFEKGNA